MGQRINSIIINENGIPIPRLINARLSTGFRFQGNRIGTKTEKYIEEDSTANSYILDEPNISYRSNVNNRKSSTGKLWSTSLSFSYSINKSNPINPNETFWMSSNTSLQLTRNWRMQYNARFNLLDKDLVNHNFSIYRDLHCWELGFTWWPTGSSKGFRLNINVKNPDLQDIKIRSSSSNMEWAN